MKHTLAALLIAAVVLVSGCVLPDWWPTKEPVPEPVPIPVEPTHRTHSHLWKPISETRGGICAIVVGCLYRQEDIVTIHINGRDDQISERGVGYGNGDRVHFYLQGPGAWYGTNIQVDLIATDPARSFSVIVPDGSMRWEFYSD